MTWSQPDSLVERALDRLYLAADAADAGQELLFFADGVGHGGDRWHRGVGYTMPGRRYRLSGCPGITAFR